MPNVFSLDLATVRYSTAALAFTTYFGQQPNAAPAGVVYDGDFTVAMPVGQPIPEFPFASEGDSNTVIVHQRYWQLAAYFRAQALGTPSKSRADLLLLDECDFQDEGGGIVSWARSYAALPQPRDVFESFSYGFQYAYLAAGPVTKVAEIALPVPSRIRCEYFHVKDLANWPTLIAPRIIPIGDNYFTKIGTGNLSVSAYFVVSSDKQILAENTSFKTWKYPYMERRSRYIAGPTLEFWGESFGVTPTHP